jgi:hypothetical protein
VPVEKKEEMLKTLDDAVEEGKKVLPESKIISIEYNSGKKYFDLLVTGAIETPDGLIISARDVANYLSDAETEMATRLALGQTVPAPTYTVHFLIEHLEELSVMTAQQWAAKKLCGKTLDKPVGRKKAY